MKPIITLTTDLGTKDYYVSSIKGSILRQCPDAHIVDISHHVPKFDISQAAFILKNAIQDFPAGTIHIIGVRPETNDEVEHVGVMYNDQYFFGADNGIFSLIFDKQPQKLVGLRINSDSPHLTFPTKDVLVKAACHIARGGLLEVIGKQRQELQERTIYRPVVDGNVIRGTVIYVDHYGNVISNITEMLFKEVGRGRPFRIMFRIPTYDITKIHRSYNDVIESERVALFGATGYLEIAINIGNASNLLGLKLNDMIRIEFE